VPRGCEGLLAASVTIGLDVIGGRIDAEVTEIAGPKGLTTGPGRVPARPWPAG
jgi:hypothetical protein